MNNYPVDRSEMVDIREVEIDRTLPKAERVADFLRQIKNPYCYRHGKYVVRVSFAKTSMTLEDRLADYIAATSSTGGVR